MVFFDLLEGKFFIFFNSVKSVLCVGFVLLLGFFFRLGLVCNVFKFRYVCKFVIVLVNMLWLIG